VSRHLRPDKKKQRQESAAGRQAAYDAMTLDEKETHLLARGCPTASNEFLKLKLS
jgi:hypothetical protein